MRFGFAVTTLFCTVIACGTVPSTTPPIGTASIVASRAQVPAGSALDVTYRFAIDKAIVAVPSRVHVRAAFVDVTGTLIASDDHIPPTPTSRWFPGQSVEYSRTILIPFSSATGPARAFITLESSDPAQQPVLAGQRDDRGYPAGTFEIAPRPDDGFISFKGGWHDAESSPDDPGGGWQWTTGRAVLSFRNPKRDAYLTLRVDARPDAASGPVGVTLRAGDTELDHFTLTTSEPLLRRVVIAAPQFGAADTVDVEILVDRTFVPSKVDPTNSNDGRELGVRVFHASVEPRE